VEAVKTLFAYGWFFYPFFTLAAFMATTAVEMALQAKLLKPREESPGLKKLFERAMKEGLLRDEDFPSREYIRANRALLYGEDSESPGSSGTEEGPPYTERVATLLRHFRNVFAHPSGHWILAPGQALDFLVLAGEVINQLWPTKDQGAGA
jgi:HEPN domain-containing protein